MKKAWPQHTILRAASLLAPGDQRAEWLKEWQSELWYIERRGATLFCLGAFRDALWLRRNDEGAVSWLESPRRCLALLGTLAAVSMLIIFYLPIPGPLAARVHLGWRDLADAFCGTFGMSCLLLTAASAVWRTPARHHSAGWQSRLRRGMFLVLKLLLMQPTIFLAFMVAVAMGRLGGLLGLGIQGAILLGLRWVFTDQQRRCPVCLRLLTEPVRIGAPSYTFLEWYGAESTCARGHGLLHTSETSASYSARPEWLGLGDSWIGLFSETAEARRRS
jgi:hypothetical protein